MFLLEMLCVLCEVGADLLCVVKMNSASCSYQKDEWANPGNL
jgi:hypothetical protein